MPAGRSLGVLALAVGGAAAYALFVGALSLRTRGVYFIMVTLAFAQMAYFVVHDTKAGGGSDGIFLYVKPALSVAGKTRARPRRAPAALLQRDRGARRHLRPAGAAARLALRPCARRHPRQRAADARRGLLDLSVQARRLRHRRRARRPRRRAAGDQGRRGQSRAALLARVGRGAADDHPRRHRQPARRGDRRGRVHAAEGAGAVGGAVRPARVALAADARAWRSSPSSPCCPRA